MAAGMTARQESAGMFERPGARGWADVTNRRQKIQNLKWSWWPQAVQVWDLRGLRHQLQKMNLDWDLPGYPAPAATTATSTIRIEIARSETRP
jgi:hypothetical protein